MERRSSASKLAFDPRPVDSKHSSVDGTSSTGEPASDIGSVESGTSPREDWSRRPWSRSVHPKRIPFLIRGVGALIPKEARSSSAE